MDILSRLRMPAPLGGRFARSMQISETMFRVTAGFPFFPRRLPVNGRQTAAVRGLCGGTCLLRLGVLPGILEPGDGRRIPPGKREDSMLTYEHCTLCPRACGVNRRAGELGFCRMPAGIRAARAAPHYGEEPVISGSFGSGTVFFSGCTLGCGFCQNEPISHGNYGKPLQAAQLRAVLERLVDEGVQNINLVTPTQFLPDILEALTPRLPVPVVYNCGGYESVRTLQALEGYVDVYLPDFKYTDAALAARLSAAPDYPETAAAAILETARQTGPCVLQDGRLLRGTLVRHLILPGCLDNSLGVVDWFADHFSSGGVLFSLMSQYTPMGRLAAVPPFDRPITEEEYAAVRSWMELRGVRNGFVQDAAASGREFIPDFDLSGL